LGKLRSMEELFLGRYFGREVIILCRRRYLRYKVSFRDLVEMLAERGLHLAHMTILRWAGGTLQSQSSAGIALAGAPAAHDESMRPICRVRGE
jgi:hypothetical protein